MAIVHFVNYKKPQTEGGMLYVLRYTMQDKKTVASDGKKYVTGVNCTPQSDYTEFNNTKKLFGKIDGRLFYHFVQSFSVEENISPETAHEIALRFAQEIEKFRGFEIVVSTHCDRDHIHSHFIMNSVNAESGKKFHITEREIEMLMQASDKICREYDLSILNPKPSSERVKPMSDREYRSAEKGESWKIRLEAVISNAMQTAVSKEHFIMLMEAEGYGVKWTDSRKNITYTTPDGKACRDSKLHYQKFLKESMENEFCYRAQITARFYNQNTTAAHRRRKGSSLRGGDRAELVGTDIYAESANRTAERYLPTLTTSEELKMYMDEQLKVLIQYTEQTEETTEQFQTAMETSAEELTGSIKQLITDTERRVGRVSEDFSSKLSLAEEQMQRHMDKMFWASLIPSAILLILELVRHILSATSAIL